MSDHEGIDRRQLLGLGAVAAASRLGLGSIAPAFAQRARGRRVIDVHCHVFNGKDIPCGGFLYIVVLKHYHPTVAGRAGGSAIDPSLEGLAQAIVTMVEADAPSIAVERDCIRRGLATCGDTPAIASLSAGRRSHLREAQMIADYERLKRGLPRRKYFKGDQNPKNPAALDAFIESLKSRGPSPIRAPAVPGTRDRASALERQRMARKLASRDYQYSTVKRWGDILGSARQGIIQEYLASFDASTYNVALFVPALVDFSHWLNDDTPSALADQVEVMDLLSRRQKTARMHGYTAFDPLRQIRAEAAGRSPTPLEIAKDAITKRGFLGVKLYSPMGFRPYGNAGAKQPFPGTVTSDPDKLGQELDRVLMALYTWCEAEGAAVLAHTSNSNGAGHGYGARAEPVLWESVLKERPTLGINWAHFGRFGTNGIDEEPASDLTKTWEWQIGGMIKDGKAANGFVDLSYLSVLLGTPDPTGGKRRHVVGALKRWFEEFDPDCKRVMFGTDWSMIVPVVNNEGYTKKVETLLREVGLIAWQLDNVFFANAVRFLGLRRGDKTRDRMEAYYKAHNLIQSHLLKFDGIT